MRNPIGKKAQTIGNGSLNTRNVAPTVFEYLSLIRDHKSHKERLDLILHSVRHSGVMIAADEQRKTDADKMGLNLQ